MDNEKIKILITSIMYNINTINPDPGVYYFSRLKDIYKDKTLFLLRNQNEEDDLMVIEISMCQGDFLYVLVDSPPNYKETYFYIQIWVAYTISNLIICSSCCKYCKCTNKRRFVTG